MGRFETFEADDYSSRMDIDGQELAIVTLLLKSVTTMYHVDELFQWVASIIVQRLHVQVATLWVLSTRQGGRGGVQLRALASQEASLPQHIVSNNQIGEVVERMLREQYSTPVQPVTAFFSAYTASSLNRYGLNYCADYFQQGNVLLTGPRDDNAAYAPLRFSMVTLIFLREQPSQKLATTLSFILEQAASAAISRGLLLPTTGQLPPLGNVVLQGGISSLRVLIPRRQKEAELLMSSNPLSRSVDIPDKQARRLYAAIDGRKNIDALSRATGINLQELRQVLQQLIAQRRIDLYEPTGKHVDAARFFKDF